MKILFVHKQILFPRDTGGKIRVLNLLKHLARWHDVTYVSNLRGGEERFLPDMEALGLRLELVPGETSKRGSLSFYSGVAANLLSGRPFTIDRNYDPAVRSRVAQLLTAEQFDLIICDTIVMARHTMGLHSSASVLFQHNVEAQILERHAELAPGKLKRAYMRAQRQKMLRFEKECGDQFDAVIAVSRQDQLLFQKKYGWEHVHTIDTAVDEEFFQNPTEKEIPGRVMFLGSMDWMPNQDGVTWFVREIWPTVLSAHPAATLHIVGRNPPASILALNASPGVSVLGSVPDVRPHLAEAAVVVVPLLVGGGTRLKIYEAMAMNRAVVSTPIGAEGLPLTPDEHVLLADDPATFSRKVCDLLASPEQRRKIGHSADAFVRTHFGSEPVARQFENICRTVVDSRRSPALEPA